MKLREALKRVLRICPKTKDQAVFRAVRFVNAGTGATIYATDGICIIAVWVDCVLPNLLVAADSIAAAVQMPGELVFVEAEGNYYLRSAQASYKLVVSQNLEFFPRLPEMPATGFTLFPWGYLKQVLHAAPAEKAGESAVATVRFDPLGVEAFDHVRLARVDVPLPWTERFVPARLFAGWPVGDCAAAITDHHAIFRIGEERRIANLVKNASYPDTTKLLSAPLSSYYVVEVSELIAVVRQAGRVSPINLVMIDVHDRQLKVMACDVSGPLDVYTGTVTALMVKGLPGVATVDAKLLRESLAQCLTPTVKVLVGENTDPVKLVTGNFTECIWQRYWG